MKRTGRIFALSIVIGAIAAACGGSSAGSSPESPLDPTGVPPTFVRVTVTPAPIDTPVPTPAARSRPSFSDAELADPVFPDWLDPDLTDEQPDDEVVFEGWEEYFTNTFVEFASRDPVHFCTDGIAVRANGEVFEDARWKVERTAAMSIRQWGKVALIAKITGGPNEGRELTFMVISREDGKILQLDWTQPTEIIVTR
ncbi:MAG: hypothetical protein O6922_02130, partial [Chloroflexi bacterium]|nr:hypothetical protein [Chloroflexota bacterium]